MPIVKVQELYRHFGKRTALKKVQFEMNPGEILGLVGANGAGKTTLLKILAGFLPLSSGRVEIFEQNPWVARKEIMKKARFSFAPPPLYDQLTAYEHLNYLSKLNGNISEKEIWKVLELVGLADRSKEYVRQFSFGMKQRLGLAQALLPLPRLLVLDEPTDGLDPLAILELRNLLRELKNTHEMAILFSSHLLVEIEFLVDKLLVLKEGEPVFYGKPEELKRTRKTYLKCDSNSKGILVLQEKEIFALSLADEIQLESSNPPSLREMVHLLEAEGVTLLEYYEKSPTLEEALMEHYRKFSGGRESE